MCHHGHGQEDKPDHERNGNVPDVEQACSFPYEETAYLAWNLGVRGGGDHADGGEEQREEDCFGSDRGSHEAAVAISGDRLEKAPPVKDVVQRASGSFEGRNNHGGPGKRYEHATEKIRQDSSPLAKLRSPVPDRQPHARDAQPPPPAADAMAPLAILHRG